LELVAVATSTRDTADEAASAYGVRAYDNGLGLARSPDVDIVTVATRVPDHRDMILAALQSGKHLYSEWPLGAGERETEELCKAADAAKVHTAIGLQLRGSPTVKRARDLLEGGAIGRLLSANIYSSTAGFGPEVPGPYVYLENPRNFANLVTIQGAHTLDLAFNLLGEASVFNSLVSRQYPSIAIGEHKEIRQRTTYDHLLFQGATSKGVSIGMEVAGGRNPEAPFRFEVVGESGTLSLQGGAARGFQSHRLSLHINGQEVHVDEGELSGLPSSAVNVGGVYAALRNDIRDSTSHVAGFADAMGLTRLIEAVLRTGGASRAA
jgi:predicted dehydrogenase